MKNIVKVTFRHFRIPYTVDRGYRRHKGPVPNGDAFPYSRKKGWLDKTPALLKPASRGGYTICDILADDGFIYRGQAMCSLADNFDYQKANRMAHGRALSAFEHDRPYGKAPTES